MDAKCRDIKRFLSRYLDKELPDQEAVFLIEEHLKNCPSCRAEFESLVLFKDLLAKKESLEEDLTFLPRLQERLRCQAQEARFKWVLDAGSLAKRLVLVPTVSAILIMFIVFSGNGLFNIGSIGMTEINEVNEETDPFVLFSYTMFNS